MLVPERNCAPHHGGIIHMYQQWGSDPLLHRQHHAILGLHPHSCGAKLQVHSTFSCVSVLYTFEVMAGSQPSASP